ncbi:MAG: 6-phosphofructokinase [Candidatus Bathyarchaeia archaeon]
MKIIAVVTSGGDAPGMNAAIRGVVRIAHSKNFEVIGFERGWEGLLTNSSRRLTPRSVGGILHLGGTILHTSRCPEFKKNEAIKKAAETLALNNVDGLIVIGGNGSFQGALELSKETGTSIVGVPASIDNDVFGTDETIGFDTAVNTAVTEIDKIRDTAVSIERIFIVEVMGVKYENEKIFRTIRETKERGKRSGIIVAAEGIGDNRQLASELEKATGAEVRLSVLGYTQRGGNPSARSRLLASLFADEAVKLLSKGRGSRAVVLRNGKIKSIGLEESCKTEKPLDLSFLNLARVLAT